MRNMQREALRGRFYGMKERCYNTANKDYPNYGGRGIKVCDEWLSDFDKFMSWALSSGFEYRLTLDRVDVNGNYCPANCRFVSRKEQNRNMRKNVVLTAFGETKLLLDWINDDRCAVEYGTLSSRIRRGMSPEEAMTKPIYSVPCVRICKQKTRKFIRNGHITTESIIEVYGESKSIREWSKDSRCSISLGGLVRRVRTGWNLEAAIRTSGLMRVV